MTQGDVNGAIGVVVGTGVSLWAAQLATTVLFPLKARRAAHVVQDNPKKTLGFGALVGVTGGVLGLVLSNQANGLLKMIGIGLLIGLLAVSVLGGAGLAIVAGERIAPLDKRLSRLGALGRGAGLLITASFLPVIGWFFLFPLLLLATVGAGARALLDKKAANSAVAGSNAPATAQS